MCQKQKIYNVQNILQIISFLGNPALLKSCYKKKKKKGEVLNFYKTYMFERTKKKKKCLYMWEDGNIR